METTHMNTGEMAGKILPMGIDLFGSMRYRSWSQFPIVSAVISEREFAPIVVFGARGFLCIEMRECEGGRCEGVEIDLPQSIFTIIYLHFVIYHKFTINLPYFP